MAVVIPMIEAFRRIEATDAKRKALMLAIALDQRHCELCAHYRPDAWWLERGDSKQAHTYAKCAQGAHALWYCSVERTSASESACGPSAALFQMREDLR
jgi:hypothetical protein